MTIEFRCDGCGRMLRADEGQRGEEARCPSCGGLTSVPALDGAATGARQMAHGGDGDHTALRIAEDDGPVMAELVCPECGEPMGAGAVICIECGFDRRIGKKRETKVKRMERHWTPPPGLAARIVGLVAAVLVFGGVCLVVVLYDVPLVPVVVVFGVLIGVAVLAAGWYDTLHLTRGRKGALLLTQTTHLCFFPAGTKVVDLGECEAIQIDAGNSSSSIPGPAWGSVATLLFVALLFGWVGVFLVRHRATTVGMTGPDTTSGSSSFAVHLLSRPRRDHVMTLYRGSDDEFMRDLVDELSAQGELEIVR
jgi:hypothetical protein